MNTCQRPSIPFGRSTLLSWLMIAGPCAIQSVAVESVKTWKAGTGQDAWHSGYSWDTDNPLDGGFPDSDDVAVFDTPGNVSVLFLSATYDVAYCNKLDVRRGNVLLQGQGIPLMLTPQTFRPSELEVDTATLSLEETQVVVDTIRLAPKPWDSATLEVLADAQIIGRQEYSSISSIIYVGDEGDALLVVRTPSTPFDGAPGAAMIENFFRMDIGFQSGATGFVTLDPGASARVAWLLVTTAPRATGAITIHESGVVEAPRAYIGYKGDATMTLMGTFDSRAQFFFDAQSPSPWALEPGASATVTIDGGRYLEDAAIDVGKAFIQIENGGQMTGTDINLGQNDDGNVEFYSSGGGELIAGGRLVVGQNGFTLLNASSRAKIESQVGIVAETAGAVGEVTLSGEGTQWISSGEMDIGWDGRATLNVQAGATLENEWGFVGRGSGQGTARIVGSGSAWINHGNQTVGNGDGSVGALTIADGASVECAYSQIGRFTGSSGLVDVYDPGSTWTVREELLVGGTGQGSLQISNGGRVEGMKRAMIGANPGSVGLAVVRGADSIWHTDAALHLGSGSSGRLRVVDGGTVENNWAFVGLANGVVGEATVSGSSSRWISNSNMAVGHHGSGSILVESGGYVEGNDLLIGRYFDGVGEVFVGGAGSALKSRGHLHVGLNGQGSLDVANGGSVDSSLDFMVASGPGSSGDATVGGSGSMLNVARSLHLGGKSGGEGGAGTLTVSQGTVTVGDTVKLWPEGALELIDDGRMTTSIFDMTDGSSFYFDDGTLTVANGAYIRPMFGDACNETIDGTNPRLALSNAELDLGQCTLMVGNHENGSLTIVGANAEGGALARSGVVFIAEHTGSKGGVVLSGDSAVIETDVLRVANAGTGELSIGSGSRVQVESLMDIGSAPPGNGNVSVQGALDTGTLIVASEGIGRLSILPAGLVSSEAAVVARYSGSTGAVSIADGGTWTIDGSCFVGGNVNEGPGGTGSVTVGQNRSGTPVLAIGGDLVIRASGSSVTVEKGNLTATHAVVTSGARLAIRGGYVRTDSVTMDDGSLELYGGTLTTSRVTGDFFNGGTNLSPGAPIGIMQVEGSFAQGGGGGPFPPGSMTIDFGGDPGAVEHDSIVVRETVSLGGTLQLRASSQFVPSPDTAYEILHATNIEDSFWNAAPGTYQRIVGSPIECRVDYGSESPFEANKVVLSECRGTGDADGNGRTNLEDFARMPACLAGPGEEVSDSCLAHDLDLNTVVDLRDFARTQIIGINTHR